MKRGTAVPVGGMWIRRALMRLAWPAVTLLLAACGMAMAGTPKARYRATASETSTAGVPEGNWSRFDFNAARSGTGPAQTGITVQNLGTLQRRTVELPGTVDSSPIELAGAMVGGTRRDVIFVTTTYGRTLAIAARTGAHLWEFAPRDISSYEGSAQITNATPVADPDGKYIYAASPDGLIHKLSVATGHQLWATRVTFDPTHEKIGTALNISRGSVIVTTGGYDGDAPPYQGHVVLIDRTTGHRTEVWNSLCSHTRALIDPPSSCSSSGSAIWARSGAVVQPGTGRILLATGNGPFNGGNDWGDSVIELSPQLQPVGHWTPQNQQQLDQSDIDLGSTAPALLPGGYAVQGGKAGILSLLKLSRLAGMSGAGGRHLGGALQNISTPGGSGVFTAPAVWQHAHRPWLFVTTFDATWGYVLGADKRLHVAWRDSFAGTSPVVAGGLLYVYDPNGQLNVLAPATGHTLHSFPAAQGHWNSPIVVGGRVVVPVGDANNHDTTGQMFIYHLPGR